jgi:23S rRNA G2445 N2-methylase RlmL
MIALAVPGLAGLLAAELESVPGVSVADTGWDGRSDAVLFTADGPAQRQALAVRLAEDVLIEVGRTPRSAGDRAPWIGQRLTGPDRLRRAVAVRARLTGPAKDRATFRVVARVLHERSFLRTDLRRELTAAIARRRPRWRPADPAELEIWALEYRPGRIVAGLRVSDRRMRQHGGRDAERPGALRPTVAAAMVRLAGPPDGALIDPCCGAGTVLAEAAELGWRAAGFDLDPAAVRATRRNAAVAVARADVRRLPLLEQCAGACVSNLPFGRRYPLPGGAETWLAAALAAVARATRQGGRVVLLAPDLPRRAVPETLRLTERIPIRLLGQPATIWAYDRH